MIRRNPLFRPVEKCRRDDFVWFINGRHYCGPRVHEIKGRLQKKRWAKIGWRHGKRIAARMALWRVTGEAPF